jgi:PAS domain S-box-containing protein
MPSSTRPASRETHTRNRISRAWLRRQWRALKLVRPAWLALCWLFGGLAIGAATWACFALHVELSTAGLVLLLVIVALSLLDSFLSSLFFVLLGAGLLNYYFTDPIFSLQVARPEDLVALVTFLVCSLIVTTLVRQARSLGHARREQALLLDLTHDGILVRDENDVIRYWNNAAEALYGWDRTEAIGKHAHTLLKTVFPAALDDIIATLVRTGHWEGELVHTTRHGETLIVSSRWSIHADLDGKRLGTIESNTDITRRKLAEDALRRSEAQYLAEAQKLSLTGSFGWNAATHEVAWSAQTYRIFDYETAQPPSIELAIARAHPEDRDAFRQAIATATATKGALDLRLRLLMPDGTTKHVHFVAHLLEGASDGALFVGAIMDVTAAWQADEQIRTTRAELERVARATVLGELSATIAHEVGQPLAAIVTYGQAAQRWLNHAPPEPLEVRTCLDSVVANGKRASEIVQRVRKLTTRGTAQHDTLSLSDAIHEAVALLEPEILRHGTTLRLDLAHGLPPLVGDRIQLQQVLVNLLVNAMQAMNGAPPEQRELLIRLYQESNGELVVAIRDSGTGVRTEDAERLFEPFFTTKAAGMGMGLAICRSIIESHGGRAWATNNTDHGATFHFTLPPAKSPVS